MHISVTKPFFCKHFLQHNMGVRKSKNTALDTERLCFKHRRVSLINALTNLEPSWYFVWKSCHSFPRSTFNGISIILSSSVDFAIFALL